MGVLDINLDPVPSREYRRTKYEIALSRADLVSIQSYIQDLFPSINRALVLEVGCTSKTQVRPAAKPRFIWHLTKSRVSSGSQA